MVSLLRMIWLYMWPFLNVGVCRLKPKKKNQKKQREPRFAFMTKSEVDHLDDGYRWRNKRPESCEKQLLSLLFSLHHLSCYAEGRVQESISFIIFSLSGGPDNRDSQVCFASLPFYFHSRIIMPSTYWENIITNFRTHKRKRIEIHITHQCFGNPRDWCERRS